MKKISIIIMLLLVALKVAAYDFVVNGIYYNIISIPNLTVEVTYPNTYSLKDAHINSMSGSWEKTFYKGDIVIPETVQYRGKDFKVIAIGQCAFACSHMRSLKLSGNIRIIRSNAFANMKSTMSGFILPKTVDIVFSLPNAKWIWIEDSYKPLYFYEDDSFQKYEYYDPNLFDDSFFRKKTLTELLSMQVKYDSRATNTDLFYIGRTLKVNELSTNDHLSLQKQIKWMVFSSHVSAKCIYNNIESSWLYKAENASVLILQDPPLLDKEFSNETYLNVTLCVPQNLIGKYKTAKGWKNFFNLEGVDASSLIEQAIKEINAASYTENEAGLLALGKDAFDKADYRKAQEYYQKAANEFDSGEACLMMGRIALEGLAGAKDAFLAEKYLLKGVELKNADACYYLGVLYEHGVGKLQVKKDKQKALQYYEVGTNLGNKNAQDAFERLKRME